MERGRADHAIVGANLRTLCAVGNSKSSKKENSKFKISNLHLLQDQDQDN